MFVWHARVYDEQVLKRQRTSALCATNAQAHTVPTARPTGMPTYIPTAAPTATPSPEQRRANEIKEAQMLGIVPQGMKTDGTATWDDLNNLLTNVIRLKTRNPAAQRTHVYLTKEEYEASNAGAQYNMVLRGVAAAEMYGTLLDIGDDKHVNNLTNGEPKT